MTARAASLGCLLAAVALLAAAPAAADFGAIRIVSGGTAQPADRAEATALSADGRFVGFQGVIGGLDGVFERNLETGALGQVAVTDAYLPGVAERRATAPSLSADGRFVSFNTRAPLDPVNDSGATPDVYVADMSFSPPAYELASARDGCDPHAEAGCGLPYQGGGGALASGRVAISADGARVAFVTSAAADLGTAAGVVPAGQVVLRDLAADTTTLVSVERDPLSGQMTGDPVQEGTAIQGENLAASRGASISADGTTVAWLGRSVPEQVPMSEAEIGAVAVAVAGLGYDEPLWRRVADGPSAPTRRIVGGTDGPFPATALTGKNTEFNASQGWLGVNVDGVPMLSADGRTVALIGNPGESTELFLAGMGAGTGRAEGVRKLTQATQVDPSKSPSATINAVPYVPITGHLFDLAIAGGGQRVLFTTARQRFPLAPPNLISTPPSRSGLVEVYMADLTSGALERVTHGTGGEAEPSISTRAEQQGGQESAAAKAEGAGSPAVSDSGLIAFSSAASNLVAEDTNEAADAFLVQATEAARLPVAPPPEAEPIGARRKQPWRLTVAASSLRDGAVRLVAYVPAAGRLRAMVAPEPDGAVRARRLGTRRAKAPRSGRVAIELRLPRRLRHLARTAEGVYAVARVRFSHSGRKALEGRVQVRFRAHSGPARGQRR